MMERKPRKGFGGRPRVREREAGERVHLGIRVTPEMKKRLEELSAETGRSQSQQAELMLERALERGNLLEQTLEFTFGRQTAGFLLLLGAAMGAAATKTNLNPLIEDWALDGESYAAARSAAQILLNLWVPKMPTSESEKAMWAAGQEKGITAVEAVLKTLQNERENPTRRALPEMMIDMLGPIAVSMIEEWPQEKKRLESDLTGSKQADYSGTDDGAIAAKRKAP